jgi:hypothetical protein
VDGVNVAVQEMTVTVVGHSLNASTNKGYIKKRRQIAKFVCGYSLRLRFGIERLFDARSTRTFTKHDSSQKLVGDGGGYDVRKAPKRGRRW